MDSHGYWVLASGPAALVACDLGPHCGFHLPGRSMLLAFSLSQQQNLFASLPAALWATSMSLLGSMGMLVAFSIVYQDEQVPQADLIA